jgi:hypothetical protein
MSPEKMENSANYFFSVRQQTQTAVSSCDM